MSNTVSANPEAGHAWHNQGMVYSCPGYHSQQAIAGVVSLRPGTGTATRARACTHAAGHTVCACQAQTKMHKAE